MRSSRSTSAQASVHLARRRSDGSPRSRCSRARPNVCRALDMRALAWFDEAGRLGRRRRPVRAAGRRISARTSAPARRSGSPAGGPSRSARRREDHEHCRRTLDPALPLSDGDLDRMLDALAEIGFRRVETVGGHLDDAARTRRKLDARGTTAPTAMSAWPTSGPAPTGWSTRPDPGDRAAVHAGGAARGARAAGGRLAGQRRGARRDGGAAGRQGLALGYHNHHWELKPYDGTYPARAALRGGRLAAELRGRPRLARPRRRRPEALAGPLPHRLAAVHVKDIAPAGENLDQDGWADVGAGVLDWPTLWRRGPLPGAKWMVLEHDKPKDPGGSARASRDFLLSTRPEESRSWSTRLGIIGCGKISDAYLRVPPARGSSGSSPRRHRPGGRRSQGRAYGVTAVSGRGAAGRSRDRDRGQPDRPAGACRGEPRRRSPASTSIPRSRSRTLRRGALRSRRPPGQGVRVGSGPGHLPGRRASGGAPGGRRGRIGRGRWRGGLRHARHGGLAPEPSFFFKRGGGPVLDIGPYP